MANEKKIKLLTATELAKELGEPRGNMFHYLQRFGIKPDGRKERDDGQRKVNGYGPAAVKKLRECLKNRTRIRRNTGARAAKKSASETGEQTVKERALLRKVDAELQRFGPRRALDKLHQVKRRFGLREKITEIIRYEDFLAAMLTRKSLAMEDFSEMKKYC